MIFKYRYRVGPAHTHVRMFAGINGDALGLCGTLTMRNNEWENFVDVMTASAAHISRTVIGIRVMQIYDCQFILHDDTNVSHATSLPLDLP